MDIVLHLDGVGSGPNSEPSEPEPVEGCGESGPVISSRRLGTATLMFLAEYELALAGNPISLAVWVSVHPSGDTYEVTWPDATTGVYRIYSYASSKPLSAELSCE